MWTNQKKTLNMSTKAPWCDRYSILYFYWDGVLHRLRPVNAINFFYRRKAFLSWWCFFIDHYSKGHHILVVWVTTKNRPSTALGLPVCHTSNNSKSTFQLLFVCKYLVNTAFPALEVSATTKILTNYTQWQLLNWRRYSFSFLILIRWPCILLNFLNW